MGGWEEWEAGQTIMSELIKPESWDVAVIYAAIDEMMGLLYRDPEAAAISKVVHGPRVAYLLTEKSLRSMVNLLERSVGHDHEDVRALRFILDEEA